MPNDEKPEQGKNTSDLSSMASDYMDLWQKQLAAMASDDAVASVMAQTVQLMNNSAAAVAAMATTQASTENRHDETTGTNGTTTTGASSGTDDHVVGQLTERLECLEKRIAALENGVVKTGE